MIYDSGYSTQSRFSLSVSFIECCSFIMSCDKFNKCDTTVSLNSMVSGSEIISVYNISDILKCLSDIIYCTFRVDVAGDNVVIVIDTQMDMLFIVSDTANVNRSVSEVLSGIISG